MADYKNRERKSPRKAAYLAPMDLILVLCEGKNTEPQYLQGFVQWCRNPRVRIEILGGLGMPRTVVARAKELLQESKNRSKAERDDNLFLDSVWCVVDVDENPYLPGKRSRPDVRVCCAIGGFAGRQAA